MDFADTALRENLITQHHVPPLFLAAAESMVAALRTNRTERAGSKSKEHETSVYVNGPLSGACHICAVDR